MAFLSSFLSERPKPPFQPQSLTSLSRKIVNIQLQRCSFVWKLELPLVLKNDLMRNYFDDNMEHYSHLGPGLITVNKYIPHSMTMCALNAHTFRQYGIYLGPDVYLAIMSLDRHYCLPAFEFGALYIYTMICYKGPTTYEVYCHDCKPETPTTVLKKVEYVRDYNIVENVLQDPQNYCCMCKSTTLFKLTEHPFPGSVKHLCDSIIDETSSEDE